MHSVYDDGLWLLFNVMSQCEIYAEESEISAYTEILSSPNDFDLHNKNQEKVEELKSKKFLIPESFDEVEALRKSFLRKKSSSGHLSLGIVLTHDCNFRCGYCYQKHEDVKLSPDDVNKIKLFFERQIESTSVNRVLITWWGGEPLIGRKEIYELSKHFIEVCDSRGIKYGAYTSTNGALLSDHTAEKLRECRLNSYHITIDGPRKYHDTQRPNRSGTGTYKKVLNGIRSLKTAYHEVDLSCALRINLSPAMVADDDGWDEFINDLQEFRDLISVNIAYIEESELGVVDEWPIAEYAKARSRIVRRFIESGFKTYDYDLSSGGFKRPGGIFCGALQDNNWMIMPGGRLSKCVVELHKPELDAGRLSVSGEIEGTEVGREWKEYEPTESAICKECDVLPICMGGCKMLPLSIDGGSRCAIKETVNGSLLERMKGIIGNYEGKLNGRYE